MRTENHKPEFREIPLKIISPSYDSSLTDLILELESLRRLDLRGSTPVETFRQIKAIFHTLESIRSARIEGNKTTIIEYIDNQLESNPKRTESIKEINNMENALEYIDENIHALLINRAFISELHKMVVNDLSDEGSQNPGSYRNCLVKISKSELVPPPFIAVPGYMEELFGFLGKADPPKYDLLKIALAHHRFAWIHPFDNGNGRTVRLFTYALLAKFGFHVDWERIINPTAVFCNDRERYYSALARADQGDDEGYFRWVEYMLSGLRKEIEKTDRLTNYDYIQREILLPAIAFCLEKNALNCQEARILELAIANQEISNSDIRKVFPKHISGISRIIWSLKEKGYLKPTPQNKHRYYANFIGNNLIRGIIFSLTKAGFLSGAE